MTLLSPVAVRAGRKRPALVSKPPVIPKTGTVRGQRDGRDQQQGQVALHLLPGLVHRAVFLASPEARYERFVAWSRPSSRQADPVARTTARAR